MAKIIEKKLKTLIADIKESVQEKYKITGIDIVNGIITYNNSEQESVTCDTTDEVLFLIDSSSAEDKVKFGKPIIHVTAYSVKYYDEIWNKEKKIYEEITTVEHYNIIVKVYFLLEKNLNYDAFNSKFLLDNALNSNEALDLGRMPSHPIKEGVLPKNFNNFIKGHNPYLRKKVDKKKNVLANYVIYNNKIYDESKINDIIFPNYSFIYFGARDMNQIFKELIVSNKYKKEYLTTFFSTLDSEKSKSHEIKSYISSSTPLTLDPYILYKIEKNKEYTENKFLTIKNVILEDKYATGGNLNTSKFILADIIIDFYRKEVKIHSHLRFPTISNHPDCCGVKLLSNHNGWLISNNNETISQEIADKFYLITLSQNKASRLAHLVYNQLITSKNNYKKIYGNIKEIYSFINPNSNAKVTAFTIDGTERFKNFDTISDAIKNDRWQFSNFIQNNTFNSRVIFLYQWFKNSEDFRDVVPPKKPKKELKTIKKIMDNSSSHRGNPMKFTAGRHDLQYTQRQQVAFRKYGRRT